MVLDVEVDGEVLVLTLSRPEALNAFTIELHGELRSALSRARKNDVGAVVITGAGRAFSAGQDLEETRTQSTTPGERLARYYNPNSACTASHDVPESGTRPRRPVWVASPMP
jgi:2-(1,2-epoxy-1,2-dihydrophenyl)acetyl-CoA isomerase